MAAVEKTTPATETVPSNPSLITANSDPKVDFKEMTFRFKKDEFGNKRDNVKCEKVPTPSPEGIVAILQKGGKELDLLLEATADVVRSVLSDFVGEDKAFDPDKFDYSKISWEAIANMPKEDRRSSNIPEETWTGFIKEYIEIMPALTGKSVEMVTTATEVYAKKMLPLKTRKPALEKLKEQLTIFTSNTKNGEAHQEILDLLNRRIENYLKADDPALLEANL